MLEFRILGPLEIWRDGVEIIVAPPRERAFLTAMLLAPNRLVTVDHLIDVLWGSVEPPAKARNTVHTWAWRLRRRLDESGVLVSQASGYVLRADPTQIDLYRFEDLLHRGRTALDSDAAADAADLLRDALRLWRGDPLADIAAERLRQLAAPRLAELHLQAVEGRVAADLALGRHAELIGELRGLTAAHPLREGLHGHLMTALYRLDRQAEALQVFATLRTALDDELGVQPGPAIQQLYRSVLRADLAPPDRQHAGAPATTRTQPVERVPAQLLADVSAFTGRAGYLADLDRLLTAGRDDNAVVIAAISGTAGVGKTALAVHWAHRVRSRFPDGQLYVNLRGFTTAALPMRPIEVLSRFLRALGIPPGQVPIDVDEAADLYRTLLAGKRVLVVLDNARDPGQVRPLLPGSPGCLVLVTSRDRLGGLVAAEGARRLTVDVLGQAEARLLLARTVGEGRVAAEPAAADDLAEVCARLPLALRIAAANLVDDQRERIAGYLARLRGADRLGALATDEDERTAIRGTFDLSYQSLPAAAQRAFRLLGLVPGPDVNADVLAAMAEIATAEAARLLDRLASAHLLDVPATGRYTCHDLLRRFAAELAARLDSEAERRTAVDRMLAYYLATADAAARTLYPEKLRLAVPLGTGVAPADFVAPAAALAWLDAERPNLVAAVSSTAERGPAPMTWLLADVLRGYFYLRMHVVDWMTVARAGLSAAQRAGDLRGQAAAHISLADLDWRHGRHHQAIGHYVEALEVVRQTGWVEGQAAILGNLGTVYWQSGQLARSAEYYREALALNERSGWLQGQAANLANLATVAWQRGELDESIEVNVAALALTRKVGSRPSEALTLNNLGETYHLLGRLAEAVNHLEQALQIHREVGNQGVESETVRCLAAVHRDAGRLDLAAELARDALHLAAETGNQRHVIGALITLAAVELRLDEPHRALDGHQQALGLARDSNYRYGQAEAMIGQATAHLRLGAGVPAAASARQALALAIEDGYRVLAGQAATVLAAGHLDQDQAGTAAGRARAALALQEQTGDRIGAAHAHAVLAEAMARLGDDQTAERHRTAADRLFAEVGAPPRDTTWRAALPGGTATVPAVRPAR